MNLLEDPINEARRIIDESAKRHVFLRLLGGVAICLRCPSSRQRNFARKHLDLDFMGLSRHSREINRIFQENGYSPRVTFNALMGHKRLMFIDSPNQRKIDVFLDRFEMCHKFDFRARFLPDQYTLSIADLLATKLQIVQITDKDFKDIVLLFLDHEIGLSDGEKINGPYLAKLCAENWGIYKTFTSNLLRILSIIDSFGLTTREEKTVKMRTEALNMLIEEAPKNLKWQIRNRFGTRLQWFEVPEEDDFKMNNQQID